jgi:DNA primase
VLEHYGTTVTDRGGWTRIKCPLHDDTHASASANLDEQIFSCFTCDICGDSYTIIMAREKIGFKDAIQYGKTRFDGNVRQVRGSDHTGLLGLPRGKGHNGGDRRFFQTWHMQ